jgi:hypothetical protein
MEGWAYFYLGNIMAARPIARALVGRRESSSDRELDISTAVESGDWSQLQAIVAREVGRVDTHVISALRTFCAPLGSAIRGPSSFQRSITFEVRTLCVVRYL